MKLILTSIAAGSLLAALAMAQPPSYIVTDLGTLPGGTFSQATFVNNNGLITGLSAAADGTQHAVLWQGGKITDLGAPGLGGPNSGAFGANVSGQVVISAETSILDPNNENFCGYNTGLKCIAAVWQNGVMTPLPTLGGNNATVGAINSLGQVAGIAETGVRDPACPSAMAVNGTGPQVLDFEAVIWGPQPGQIVELRPLPGDTVAIAAGINDKGQAVGTSGLCGNTILPGFEGGPHAVFWDTDGSAHDLGNLGGTGTPASLGVNNIGFAINNQGQVAGQSVLPGNRTFHPFLWASQTGMQDLGVLPGDLVGAGLAMNNRGAVVGASVSAPGPAGGNPRAYLWRNGVMTDLNTLVQADSPLYLLTAFGINDAGVIIGFGVTDTGDVHGFQAAPVININVTAAGPSTSVSYNAFQINSNQINLSASQSTSSNPGPLSYSWTLSQGSSGAAILQGNTATPIFEFTRPGTYQFNLTVTDATGLTATATVTVQYT